MICLVLAAGYATRLYPLTQNFPKPLLKVGEKSILDHLLDDIDKSCDIKKYVIISNDKYYSHFLDWKKTKNLPVEVINDGSKTNETRLGAVKDICFAIEKLKLDDDLLIIAGDNILDFSLKSFIQFFNQKKASCVMRYFESSIERLKQCGVAECDEQNLVVNMEEKPQFPKSNWTIPPFYLYAKKDIPLLLTSIQEGCKVDAPGSLVAWLSKKVPLYAMTMTGKRYDIGDIKSYEEVQKNYGGIK